MPTDDTLRVSVSLNIAHAILFFLCSWEDYVGKPIPVDASPVERMKEMRAGRVQLCVYNKEMHDATLVHFPSVSNEPGGRLLGMYGGRLSRHIGY